MMRTKSLMIAVALMLMTGAAQAKTFRATEMNGSVWSDLSKGRLNEATIEFRQGDEIPVNLTAEGDLIETTRSATSYIGVKRDFWLKVQQSKILISMDGTNFKDMKDAVSGSVEANAGSDQSNGVANAINVAFKTFMK